MIPVHLKMYVLYFVCTYSVTIVDEPDYEYSINESLE